MYGTTTFTPTCTCRQHVRPPAICFSPISLSRRVVRTLAIWHERSRRREAWRHLDDNLLEDIGVTRQQAKREAEKTLLELWIIRTPAGMALQAIIGASGARLVHGARFIW